ncbi:unnamed protein product [Allacma fusca]|uniref:Uncharacterized protein n=1 Tax=Allacma fusca TaxID=39272 RepID=A0A8J2KPV8_9HEXA|nr:unnamed protein product [Allacma fusca]
MPSFTTRRTLGFWITLTILVIVTVIILPRSTTAVCRCTGTLPTPSKYCCKIFRGFCCEFPRDPGVLTLRQRADETLLDKIYLSTLNK